MKKRACRHRCDICAVNFESWDRFSVHLTSRGHRMKQLANTTATENIQLVSDAFESITNQFNGQDEMFFVQETLYDDNSYENISGSESDDTFSVFDSLSDFEEESNGDSENVPRPSQHGLYFPFPSEIFFLLYSYVHNVSRPKVFFNINFYECVFLCRFKLLFAIYTIKIRSFFIDKDLQVCTGYVTHNIAHIACALSCQFFWCVRENFRHGFLSFG